MKARYKSKGLRKSSKEQDPWPPFQSESFTSIALVHQKIKQLQAKQDAINAARLRAIGDIEKIPELTSTIRLNSINQIFTSVDSDDQSPMVILIEGHPGIGKTTLAKQICLKWAKNELLVSDEMVFLLMLRDPDVQKITNQEELLKYALPKEDIQPVSDYLRTTNGV